MCNDSIISSGTTGTQLTPEDYDLNTSGVVPLGTLHAHRASFERRYGADACPFCLGHWNDPSHARGCPEEPPLPDGEVRRLLALCCAGWAESEPAREAEDRERAERSRRLGAAR